MNKQIKNKVFITSAYACPLRVLDASKLRNYFSLNNFEIVESYSLADYYLFISCSVTLPIVESELVTIKELSKSSCELIVMGCLPGANEDDLKKVFGGKYVSTKNIEDVDKLFPNFWIKYRDVPETYKYDFGDYILGGKSRDSFIYLILKYGFSGNLHKEIKKHRDYKKYQNANQGKNISEPRFIKVCSGCTNNCTYCNIREAVGNVKSKSIECLKKEYVSLLHQGNRLFHFLAEDICSYGLDIKSSLVELLISLQEVNNGYHTKWSLEGVHPAWLVENRNSFFPLIQSKQVWEITISVEHGSDRILKLMNRHYSITDVKKVLKTLRSLNPAIKVNAMLILGFPSETEDDFLKVLDLLKTSRFDCVTVSKYSEFAKRASANIFPKVPAETVKSRLQRTKQLLLKLKTPIIRGDM